jgi:hypothetical protein
MFEPQAMGGTEPKSALLEAFRVLAGSSVRNRMVIMLTDGEWWGQQADTVIAALNESGVTTVLAKLGGYVPAGFTPTPGSDHGAQYAANIDDLGELPRLFRRIAIEQIGRWS